MNFKNNLTKTVGQTNNYDIHNKSMYPVNKPRDWYLKVQPYAMKQLIMLKLGPSEQTTKLVPQKINQTLKIISPQLLDRAITIIFIANIHVCKVGI